MTPVMFVDPNGDFALLFILGCITVGTLVISMLMAKTYNNAAEERLSFAKVDFSDADLSDIEIAKLYIDQEAQFAVYENAAKTTPIFNGLKLVLQSIAGAANVDSIFGKALSPEITMVIDVDLELDAIALTSNPRLNQTDQTILIDYYIVRYNYWKEMYND
ncbi:hypothetical protein KQ51_01173 [Candidatus Izimaplasma bacterium HR1]|jgi:hypothetical protein|nr:hypothetical protein KQ51_01173 [Candidatus Izimaplasma bacterium HR1]